MDSPRGLLVGLLVTAAVLGFAANVDQVLAWAEDHEQLAAWVQAIGAVIGLWAAFEMAHTQIAAGRRIEAERRSHEARIRLAAVQELLAQALQVVDNVREQFDEQLLLAPSEHSLKYLRESRERFARIDPLQLPSAALAIVLVNIPRQVEILEDSWADLRRFAVSNRHPDAGEAFRRESANVRDLLSQALKECERAMARLE